MLDCSPPSPLLPVNVDNLTTTAPTILPLPGYQLEGWHDVTCWGSTKEHHGLAHTVIGTTATAILLCYSIGYPLLSAIYLYCRFFVKREVREEDVGGESAVGVGTTHFRGSKFQHQKHQQQHSKKLPMITERISLDDVMEEEEDGGTQMTLSKKKKKETETGKKKKKSGDDSAKRFNPLQELGVLPPIISTSPTNIFSLTSNIEEQQEGRSETITTANRDSGRSSPSDMVDMLAEEAITMATFTNKQGGGGRTGRASMALTVHAQLASQKEHALAFRHFFNNDYRPQFFWFRQLYFVVVVSDERGGCTHMILSKVLVLVFAQLITVHPPPLPPPSLSRSLALLLSCSLASHTASRRHVVIFILC